MRKPTPRARPLKLRGRRLERSRTARRAGAGKRAPVCRRSRGKVAGLAVFQLVCGEASLYAVSTAPAFRRQGVARALLSWAFAALCLQGAQDVFLEVRAQNSAAQALYLSLGFVQTGLRRNFYATPADDAVLMQKTL
ncbi:MAG: GNAT family N-acetyltransferase [Ruthenibacterium lactatiformans]